MAMLVSAVERRIRTRGVLIRTRAASQRKHVQWCHVLCPQTSFEPHYWRLDKPMQTRSVSIVMANNIPLGVPSAEEAEATLRLPRCAAVPQATVPEVVGDDEAVELRRVVAHLSQGFDKAKAQVAVCPAWVGAHEEAPLLHQMSRPGPRSMRSSAR